MNLAVVDASTHLLHFSRMPNAKVTSISIAIDKAFTAAGHKVGTHKVSIPNPFLFFLAGGASVAKDMVLPGELTAGIEAL